MSVTVASRWRTKDQIKLASDSIPPRCSEHSLMQSDRLQQARPFAKGGQLRDHQRA